MNFRSLMYSLSNYWISSQTSNQKNRISQLADCLVGNWLLVFVPLTSSWTYNSSFLLRTQATSYTDFSSRKGRMISEVDT